MTDPIADMLTRMRNALAVRKPDLIMPFSKVKFNIAKVLEKENYINKVEKVLPSISDDIFKEKVNNQLQQELKYKFNKCPQGPLNL